MLRPFLLVGVGGSGGKTLRVVRDNLAWALHEAGWPAEEGFPKAWQFLQIDVASAPDGDDPDLPPQLPPRDFLGMVNAGLTYTAMDTALTHSVQPEHRLDSLGGWCPDPNKVQVAITRGAGQYRALGRVVSLTRLDEIKKRVDRAVDAITDVDVTRQLGLLTTLLGKGQPRPESAEPVTLVVASIAGGSGAGAVLDVCDVLRAAGKTWLDESVGILFAPDVFDEIPEAARRGVRPNALATLSELVSGSWSFEGRDGGITDSSARLYQARGVETTSITRLGPRYPVLVGARNADVSYGSQNEIYRGIGSAMSEWVTSVHLQDAMSAYFSGNRQATAVALMDRLGLKQRHHETPFSALGFARMSLGRDLFARYSSQYLARAATRRITGVHLDSRPADDRRTDEELVADKASQAWPAFLGNSRLDERGVEANNVLDALRPKDTKQVGRTWIEESLIAIKAGEIPADGLPVDVWQDRIEKRRKEQGPQLRELLRSSRLAEARRWVAEIQESLPGHALDALATHGGPVTLKLLDMLSQELETVVRELPEERGQLQQKASRAASDIRVVLGGDGRGRIPASSNQINAAVGRAAGSVGFEAEADLVALVEELLRDLRTGLLAPLARALRDGLEVLENDSRRQAGVPSKIEFWPYGDTIPARLRPAKNEFLLDELDQFPATMRRLVCRDTGKSAILDAETAVLREVIIDADGRKRDTSRPYAGVDLRRSWVPQVADLLETMAAPAPATFILNIGADSLLQRAEDWIKSDQRQFGRYLAQSLSQHLTDPEASPAQAAARTQRFAGQLKAAIGRAKPLVNIDRELLSLVHDKAEAETTLVIDQIPLPAGSEAAEAARQVLSTSKASIADDQDRFTDSAGTSVSVFGMLTEPYEPVVFTSMMKPIVDEWAEVRLSDDARQSFWTWRRARTLPEFIPTAPAVRRAMIRGWFSALVLGQVSGLPDASSGIGIWGPAGNGGKGSVLAFPHPLLRAVGSVPETIAALLESLPVALLDVFSTRSLKPLGPYHRIRDLGAAGDQQGFESYETLNRELADWVTHGGTRPGAPVPDDRIGSASDPADVRSSKLVARLDDLKGGYARLFEEQRQRSDVAAVTRDFELRHDILEALEDLIRAVKNANSADIGVFT